MHILVNTGGGDAPGLNAVIRSIVIAAKRRRWQVTGIRNSYEGLLDGHQDKTLDLGFDEVKDISNLGGTILGTSNKNHPFRFPIIKNNKTVLCDVSDQIIKNFKKLKADALITIGGDGSLNLGYRFFQKGMPVVGVPKTIDNDLDQTSETFGFDTAVSIASQAIERLKTTAKAHQRVMIVEVMGRHAGWIALHAGVASDADVILIPEIEYQPESIFAKINELQKKGIEHAIVVVAEGAKPKGGDLSVIEKSLGREIRLGGLAEKIALSIHQALKKETRFLVLGHLQRGGSPTAYDRLLATRLGAASVRLVAQKQFGSMVASHPPIIDSVPLELACKKRKLVPVDSDTIQTARDLGISFGD